MHGTSQPSRVYKQNIIQTLDESYKWGSPKYVWWLVRYTMWVAKILDLSSDQLLTGRTVKHVLDTRHSTDANEAATPVL